MLCVALSLQLEGALNWIHSWQPVEFLDFTGQNLLHNKQKDLKPQPGRILKNYKSLMWENVDHSLEFIPMVFNWWMWMFVSREKEISVFFCILLPIPISVEWFNEELNCFLLFSREVSEQGPGGQWFKLKQKESTVVFFVFPHHNPTLSIQGDFKSSPNTDGLGRTYC